MSDHKWRELNRANWNERVPIHLAAPIYDRGRLHAGTARRNAIEEAELGPVDGMRLLHLQCHFGHDSLILAQQGATVVGLDFSPPAIAAARAIADELGLAERARFVEADLYDAPTAIPESASFDRVYVTWGAICWLPDIAGWARIVAHFLKPGGSLYLAEGHPAALVLDDKAPQADGRPGFYVPYFHSEPLEFDDPTDYADSSARLTNSVTREWIHPISAVVTSLIAAGLRLDWLHEHDAITWRMFACLTQGEDRLYRWPDKPWLPLAYSLQATKPVSTA
jgi:SAM-dependent methyltransferase